MLKDAQNAPGAPSAPAAMPRTSSPSLGSAMTAAVGATGMSMPAPRSAPMAPMAGMKTGAREQWKDIVARKKKEHGVPQADKADKPEAFKKTLKDADRDYTSKSEKKAAEDPYDKWLDSPDFLKTRRRLYGNRFDQQGRMGGLSMWGQRVEEKKRRKTPEERTARTRARGGAALGGTMGALGRGSPPPDPVAAPKPARAKPKPPMVMQQADPASSLETRRDRGAAEALLKGDSSKATRLLDEAGDAKKTREGNRQWLQAQPRKSRTPGAYYSPGRGYRGGSLRQQAGEVASEMGAGARRAAGAAAPYASAVRDRAGQMVRSVSNAGGALGGLKALGGQVVKGYQEIGKEVSRHVSSTKKADWKGKVKAKAKELQESEGGSKAEAMSKAMKAEDPKHTSVKERAKTASSLIDMIRRG